MEENDERLIVKKRYHVFCRTSSVEFKAISLPHMRERLHEMTSPAQAVAE
jgi:hypothetical protein